MRETDEMINKKIMKSLEDGLKVILCVGEKWEVRRKGFLAASYFIKNQLSKDIEGIERLGSKLNNLMVVYEPIWAISTTTGKRKETGEGARKTIDFIKDIFRRRAFGHIPKVLYGGSVNHSNIKEFIKHQEIDGVLVGGASLKAIELKKMINIAGGIVEA